MAQKKPKRPFMHYRGFSVTKHGPKHYTIQGRETPSMFVESIEQAMTVIDEML